MRIQKLCFRLTKLPVLLLFAHSERDPTVFHGSTNAGWWLLCTMSYWSCLCRLCQKLHLLFFCDVTVAFDGHAMSSRALCLTSHYFFIRYKCKRSTIALSWTVGEKKKGTHSNSCPCNSVNPDWRPSETENLPFASSGQGLQVRSLGEKQKGCWGLCILLCYLDAVLDLQRCPGSFLFQVPMQPHTKKVLSSSTGAASNTCSALTQLFHVPGASTVLNSNACCRGVCLSSPNLTVKWKFLVSCFWFQEEINSIWVMLVFFFGFSLSFRKYKSF